MGLPTQWGKLHGAVLPKVLTCLDSEGRFDFGEEDAWEGKLKEMKEMINSSSEQLQELANGELLGIGEIIDTTVTSMDKLVKERCKKVDQRLGALDKQLHDLESARAAK